MEDGNLLDTVDALRWEVALDITHHERTGFGLDGTIARVVKARRTQVRGRDNDGVAEVNNATLAIGEAPIV